MRVILTAAAVAATLALAPLGLWAQGNGAIPEPVGPPVLIAPAGNGGTVTPDGAAPIPFTGNGAIPAPIGDVLIAPAGNGGIVVPVPDTSVPFSGNGAIPQPSGCERMAGNGARYGC